MTTTDHRHRRRDRRGLPAPGPRLAEGELPAPTSAAPCRCAPAASRRGGAGRHPAGSATSSACCSTAASPAICVPKEYGGLGLTPDAPARAQRGERRLRDPRISSRSRPSCRAWRCCSSSAPRSRSCGTSPPCSRARRSGCSSSPSRAAAPTSPAALTTAVRDGDEWVVNGSKVWTTGAWFSDYGLCLLRTNWDVPEAPRAERVHHQDPPARHRAAPDRDDQRLQGVLPGVHHRPPRARLRPGRRGRPGLDRRHPLDVPREERHGRRFAVRHRHDPAPNVGVDWP